MYETSKVIIQNDIDSIEPIIEYVRSIGRQLKLNNKERYRICYALEESLQNSILFDFEPDDIEEVEIEINRIASGLKITISDQGIPKNPFAQTPQSLEDLVSDISFESIAQGDMDQMNVVSEFVIHKLLDRYTSINKGKDGRSVEMVIYASQSRIKEETVIAEHQALASKENFSSIRQSLSADITGISRLFYKSYGYTYSKDVVYYPERLAKSIETEELISMVAISDSEKVIGHIALIEPYEGANITEWGMAISDPLFRGQGIMTQLIEIIMNRAVSTSYKGIFAHSVTNHEFTQKICKAHDFSDVALLVGYSSADTSFRKIHTELQQRGSTVINFKALDSSAKASLFVPQHHQEMIKKLYAGIGVQVIQKSQSPTHHQRSMTQLTDTIIPAKNIAEIVLKHIGSDALEMLKSVTKKICIAKIDVLYLLIDLEDFEAVQLVEKFEEMGYIFSGIFPHYHHKHTLVLQYFNNITFNYKLIHSYTPLAIELKNYIQSFDTNQINERE